MTIPDIIQARQNDLITQDEASYLAKQELGLEPGWTLAKVTPTSQTGVNKIIVQVSKGRYVSLITDGHSASQS